MITREEGGGLKRGRGGGTILIVIEQVLFPIP